MVIPPRVKSSAPAEKKFEPDDVLIEEVPRTGFTWPGHKYLGPGNSLHLGEATNEVDLIAQIHDVEYSLAKTDEEVREADKKAIESFWNAQDRGTGAGLLVDSGHLGAAGIALKYGVESLTGVLYGKSSSDDVMSKRGHVGNQLYGERQKAIHDAFKKACARGEVKTLAEFRQTAEYKAILEAHRKDSEVHKRLKGNDPGASTSADANNRSATHRNPYLDSDSPSTTSAGGESERDLLTSSDILNLSDQSLPRENSPDLPEQSAMDISESGTSRGPNTGLREGASGVQASASSVRGNNTPSTFRRSTTSTVGHLNFTKSRVMYSYGYSTELITEATERVITTPMALIPVDFLPFYISEAEFMMLPVNCKVDEVWCTVTPIGTRTAFDTGSTLSGTATSEYIPIGLKYIGLNLDFYGDNHKFDTATEKPMKPTGVNTLSTTDMIKKYYEDVASHAMCVPRSISEYFCHRINYSTIPMDKDRQPVKNYIVNTSGLPQADQKIEQFLINNNLNVPIVEYSYKPRAGLITRLKEHYIPHSYMGKAIQTPLQRPVKHKLLIFEGKDNPISGDVGLGSKWAEPQLVNTLDSTYIRQIENYNSFNLQNGGNTSIAQPQVHVGIQATPQLNPASEASDFLNSCVYWKVDCGIVMSYNTNSAFTKQNVSWPREVTFIENCPYKYTNGSTVFGHTDNKNTIGSMDEELEEYEIIDRMEQQASKKKRVF